MCMIPEILIVTRIFFHLGPFFCTKNRIFEKMKKNIWRYHHFTEVYYKWQWFLRYEVQQADFISAFLAIFCPFNPITAQKMKYQSKKRKKQLEISSFYTGVPKTMIIDYTVPEIWHVTDVIVIFHFGLFFALLPP